MDKSPERAIIWREFIQDYTPNRVWFHHITWLLVLSMTIANEWMKPTWQRGTLIILMLNMFAGRP